MIANANTKVVRTNLFFIFLVFFFSPGIGYLHLTGQPSSCKLALCDPTTTIRACKRASENVYSRGRFILHEVVRIYRRPPLAANPGFDPNSLNTGMILDTRCSFET